MELRLMLASAGELSIDQAFLDAYATSTFWHESFHGWQQTRLDGLDGIWDTMADQLGDTSTDATLALDASAAYRQWFTADYQLLLNARDAATAAERKSVLEQWVAHQDAYDYSDVTPGHRLWATTYEVLEGGARYVEEIVFRHELDGAQVDLMYAHKPSEYTKLTGKYYNTGALKAQLLDLISPGWQASFTMVEGGFDPYIIEAVAKLP
jgi:hypothetical protein